MLVVKRVSRWRDVGVLVALFGTLIMGYIVVLGGAFLVALTLSSRQIFDVASTLLSFAGGFVLVWVLLGAALILAVSLRRGAAVSAIGPNTPGTRKNRLVVESLAARSPDDGVAAFLLARRVLSAVPPGRVLVAVARTSRLQQVYVRLGFTKGEDYRVYRET